MYRIILALVFAGAAGIGGVFAVHESGLSLKEWLVFPAWEILAGNAHGGTANLDDVGIYYKTFGNGPPVLVLHGGLGSLENMSRQIMALAKCHLVIAADIRGHGRSSDSSAPFSYATLSDDMLKLLDYLHIEKTDIVGWSDGGIIGLHLAIRHPERVEKLVAVGANYDVDGLVEKPILDGNVPGIPLRYRLFAPDPGHWPALYRKVVTMWQTQPHYGAADLNKIEAKTLIMAGAFDVIRPAHTHQLAAAIPNSQEIVIGGASHALLMEKPEISNAYILDFLGACNTKSNHRND
jgi:pimeloyl-ACP methyl ester carboxylesterase